MTELTDEQAVVLTVLTDRARRGDGPGLADAIAAGTAWPGARRYGARRTVRVLRELERLGLARRSVLPLPGATTNAGQRPARIGVWEAVCWSTKRFRQHVLRTQGDRSSDGAAHGLAMSSVRSIGEGRRPDPRRAQPA